MDCKHGADREANRDEPCQHPPGAVDRRGGQSNADVYVAERAGNPFTRSARGGRALSALQLPWFTLMPPAGLGVLTTVGRRTGRTRRKCVRVIRQGDTAYLVAIRRSAWLRNLEADPNVRLRMRGGTFRGVARPLHGADEMDQARGAYCDPVHLVDYLACTLHRRGCPTAARVRKLQRTWFEKGTPVAVALRSS